MEQPALETNQPADMTASQIAKCPKSFSIESIISTKSKNDLDVSDSRIMQNGDKNLGNPFASSFYFPPNVSMASASATSIYNPWIHNYFLQQQKLPENVFEMMRFGSTNHAMIKEKFNELFANNSTSSIENRLFSHMETDRNVSALPPRFIEQYFGGGSSNRDLSSDYYKKFNSYGNILSRGDSDNTDIPYKNRIDTSVENPINNVDEIKTKYSEYDNSIRNDDSGPDENVDDELDSDCNSEISLDMSPDGDNNTQGLNAKIFDDRIFGRIKLMVQFNQFQINSIVNVRAKKIVADQRQIDRIPNIIQNQDDDELLLHRNNCWNWNENFMQKNI